MKSLRYLLIFVALFTVTSVRGAMADSDSRKTVTVTNSTSYTMYEFYASASDNATWDTTNNLVASQAIGTGQTTTITISDGTDNCEYDLMAVLYGSSEYAYDYEVNVCNGNSAQWNVQSN